MKKTICHFYASALLLIFAGMWANSAVALTFNIPTNTDTVVGKPQWMQTHAGDNFNIIGRRYDVGYFQLIEANPGINPDNVPPNTIVVIPSQFVLPRTARKGIIISLAELRLYYYPTDGHTVITYPIGIGREGWLTPQGTTRVIAKTVNPVWTVPESIKKDRAKDGVVLPNSVQPGPENPLGGYAMRLGIDKQTYLIHGTNDFTGVGRRSSSGCIRMLPEDVEVLFSKVTVGTPVTIINTPYKAGWLQGKLYLEAHVPLQEQTHEGAADLSAMKRAVQAAITASSGIVYWSTADKIAARENGIPQVIGHTKDSA